MSPPERTFRALSDRNRLRILNLLREGELCVGDLVLLLAVPQPTASRHLAYLRKAGLVTARRAGLWSFYALCPAATEFQHRLHACLDACRDVEPELAADTRNAAELRKSGGCCPEVEGEPPDRRSRCDVETSAIRR